MHKTAVITTLIQKAPNDRDMDGLRNAATPPNNETPLKHVLLDNFLRSSELEI